MKKLNTWPVFLMIGLVLSFSSCKKSSTASTEDDSVSATDNNTVTNASNLTANDAAAAADNESGLSRGYIWGWICGTSDTSTSPQSITINYDGSTTCGGVTRSGSVTIALTYQNKWVDTGAIITVTISKLVVTDVITKNAYTINGTITITNVNGGYLGELLLNNSDVIVRRHTGNMQVTFPNNLTKTWTFDRTFTWTAGTVGAEAAVFNWAWSTQASGGVESSGTNRYGVSFTNTIDSTIQINSYLCSGIPLFQPWVGMYTHHVDNRTVSIQFGTDSNGNSVDNPADCNLTGYGYFIRYQNSKTGANATLFWPYWL